ncbi:MAG TPA: wax ester/triacylglycerol synthase family O-acyltransferase [Candidatus Acidoferrales bacterium]|nr:wax ester/triacylglycerol synthase family O-acyltransferase [Candidatus Acidoferrales bacterium]
MAENAYDRLSFLDNSFLIMETPTSPMHVAGTATFEAGPLQTADGGIDIEKIRDYVASRLYLIPRYRQRLAHVPIENHPVWVDDEHFNVDYHVRHIALPKPGDERQLRRLAARVMAQHLDRQKPLWEIWVLEGLANPAHFVMISKIHHCMVDGVSSVDLLKVLLKPEPTDAFEPPPQWMPRPAPSRWQLATDALGRYARLPLEIARSFPQSLQEARDPDSGIRASLNALRQTLSTGMRGVSDTPLNQRIGPHRRLDWLTMDLDTVKGVKQRVGGTLNDVVLATVAGALRRFLQRRGVDLAPLDFRVMAPVSVRTEPERGTLGNHISAWMVPMPLGEPDPIRRLAKIRKITEHLKDSNQALSAAVLTKVGEWTPSTLLSLGARLATRVLPFNLVVTNVPGPQLPLYMLGARMVDNFGFLPLIDSLCLGVVLFSYAGKLCWGFTGDWDRLPDLDDFVGDIEASFHELSEVPEPMAIQAVPRKAARTRGRTRRGLATPSAPERARARRVAV